MRNGKNGKFTCEQFIEAIPGTGGIISDIADKVGCSWNTAKSYIEKHPTIKQAFENERNRITDKARHNIIEAIEDKQDLQMSKWWLQVMDPDFVPIERREHSTKDGEPLGVRHSVDFSSLTNQEINLLARIAGISGGAEQGTAAT